jgi:hypothetical protein
LTSQSRLRCLLSDRPVAPPAGQTPFDWKQAVEDLREEERIIVYRRLISSLMSAATYNLPFPFPNQIISRDMAAPGVVTLKCNGGHTWMNAEMMVVTHPYYAVTDESGKFELTNVPPGQYELVAWHEGWSVARHEGSFDVLTTKRVERPIFGPPRTWEKSVTVAADGQASVNFVIGEK